MGIIFAAVLLVFVAICVLWSVFVRKLVKTRLKSILVIACVVVALIGTIAIKDLVLDPAFVEGTLLPMLGSSIPQEVSDLATSSDVLREAILGLPLAMLSPMIFVIIYTVLYILTSIAYLFVLIFAGRKLKRNKKNRGAYAKAQSLVWSACSAVLSLLVILVPLAFYGSLIDDALVAVSEAGVVSEETQEMVEGINDEYVAPITKGTVVEVFRAFGGDMILDEMTSFPLKGEKIYIKNEFHTLAGLAGDVMPLTQAGAPSEYGEEEADALVGIVDTLTNSKFLMAVASEAVYFLTEDMVNGEDAMPMADNEMFGDLITRMITIIHNDSKDTTLFAADLKTVAEMAGELVKGGVLSNMEDTDALMEELAGGTTIKNVILALGKNNSMKVLIPEVTNIGIEAIASFVEVKADAETAYNELLEAVAADLNSVKGLDSATQATELAAKLADTFDHAGLDVDEDTVDLFAAAMILEIASMRDDAEVTADDVQAFFAITESVSTVSLKNAEEYGKITLLVFLDELVIDVDVAAGMINDSNVNQEAEAIGGIFSQAGSLLNEVSGEEINIGTMAESVGGILNSLNGSVCVGQERTSKLFIAIVQSSIVRDAANMDIVTATELGTKGSTGDNVDYAKTFKTISNVMDVLENMNSSTAEGMTQEDLATVLKDLNPQTAGMIESYITEDRLSQDFGLDAEQSGTAAPIISDVFGYMGSADMTEEECQKEAEALSDVMNLVTSASDKANNSEAPAQSVFGGEDSILGKDAAGTVDTFMSSESIKHSLNNNADKLEEDAFGMQDMLQQDDAKNEKQELEDAMKNYYETTEYESEEDKAADKETLTNLGKLFGFTSDEMSYILGEQ